MTIDWKRVSERHRKGDESAYIMALLSEIVCLENFIKEHGDWNLYQLLNKEKSGEK